MKLAAALLLCSFAACAFADEPAPEPPTIGTPPRVIRLDPVDGMLVLVDGATIDFAELSQYTTPGPLRGYVLIYVQGEPLLIPAFSLPKAKHQPPR